MPRLTRAALTILVLIGVLPEWNVASTPLIVAVTRFDDPFGAGSCPTDCSLRQAIAASAAGGTVTLPPGTYSLTLGVLRIRKNLEIDGAGARSTTIRQTTENRVIELDTGVVTIAGVTITGGHTDSFSFENNPGVGGGIWVDSPAALTIVNAAVTGNFAQQSGGGIDVDGPLTMTGCTVSGNSTSGGFGIGGGIDDFGPSVTIANSTIAGNTASADGGGLLLASTATLTNVTVAGNSAGGNGGGIHVYGGAPIATGNSLLSANSGGNCDAPLVSKGHNVSSDATCGLSGSGDLESTDAHLGSLQNNGGSTDTMALPSSSPAVDAGDDASCPAIDQRGITRPQGAHCDIGAYEVVASATAVDWPMLGFNAARTGFNPYESTIGPDSVAALAPAFVTLLARGADLRASPVVAGGVAYVADGTYAYAIDATSGQLKWQVAYGGAGAIVGSPAVAGGLLYVTDYWGYLAALNVQTGVTVWQAQLPGAVWNSPAYVNGALYLVTNVQDGGDGAGELIKFDAATGTRLWTYAPDPFVRFLRFGSPAVADGKVFVPNGIPGASGVTALDAATGAVLWSEDGAHSIEYSSPVVANGLVYIASADALRALDEHDGHVVWRTTQAGGTAETPAVANGIVFIGDDGSFGEQLQAFDALTGAPLSTTHIGPMQGAPVVANGVVYAANLWGYLYAYPIHCGSPNVSCAASELWAAGLNYPLNTNSAVSRPVVVDGTLYMEQHDPNDSPNASGPALVAYRPPAASTSIDTTTLVSEAPDPSVFGQPVIVSVAVAAVAPGSGSPTGTVAVTDGTGAVCTATLANGAGSCVLTPTTAGAKMLTATYGGDALFNASAGTHAHSVTPAPLTISTDNQTTLYGAAVPPLTVSYSGFVNGDTPGNLSTQPTVTTTANAASPVGTYPITVSGAVDPNYVISYVSGTLTILPLPPVVINVTETVHVADALAVLALSPLTIAADNKAMVVGGQLPPLTVSYSGFVNGDTAASLTTPPAVTTTATAASPVGTYPITVSGAVDPKYVISYVAGTLTIVQPPPVVIDVTETVHVIDAVTVLALSPLTITADNKTIVYGAALPPLTVSYSGFVNGDSAANLTTPPTMTTTATATSPIGTYPITVGGAVDSNYVISYVGGTLTILQPPPVAISITETVHVADHVTAAVPDTTPPVLTLPANIIAEATGPTGAVVTFIASAMDAVDGSTPVVCTPASGSTFALRVTAVSCSSIDRSANRGTGTFSVTVADTTPPTLAAAPNITTGAVSPQGAMVSFGIPAAADLVDPAPVVTAAPPSGSLFPIGTTAVTLTATDASHNARLETFRVTVLSPAQMTSKLIATTTELGLKQGATLLTNALASIAGGTSMAACNQIAAFKLQAQAQSGKGLTVWQANALIESAAQVGAALGCK